MSADKISNLRQDLASRVVRDLNLPAGMNGSESNVDKFRLQADPRLLRDLATLVADALPSDTEVLVGMELGGVPLATAVSLHTGLPWALLRRSPRAGITSTIAGTSVDGRNCVLIKDAVRGGSTLIPATSTLRSNNALVTHAAVGLSWNPTLSDTLRPAGVTPIAALTLADLGNARTH
ncbi:hypothetical protein [Nocardia sp. NBC_01388]|uniref:hypothetical protein n=1 Tax=Nocardia sp. NBC_01388 TaxID=2903596 RepID=UPI00324AAA9D